MQLLHAHASPTLPIDGGPLGLPGTTIHGKPAMTRSVAPMLALIAALAVSACGSSAKNEQAEAAATIAADPNATMAEAVSDVEAASDKAIGPEEVGAGNAADAIEDSANEIVE